MHYLITGGAGFIGSHLAERLLDRGDRVVLLHRAAHDVARVIRNEVAAKGDWSAVRIKSAKTEEIDATEGEVNYRRTIQSRGTRHGKQESRES